MKEDISIYEDILGIEALPYREKNGADSRLPQGEVKEKNPNGDKKNSDIRETVIENFRRAQEAKKKLN